MRVVATAADPPRTAPAPPRHAHVCILLSSTLGRGGAVQAISAQILLTESDPNAAAATGSGAASAAADVDMGSFPLLPLHQIPLLSDELIERALLMLRQLSDGHDGVGTERGDLQRYADKQLAAMSAEQRARREKARDDAAQRAVARGATRGDRRRRAAPTRPRPCGRVL